MDIPVSSLNERMASRLPREFPLGLVFVVGRVERVPSANGRDSLRHFHLVEGQHRIRCVLSERAARSSIFDEGDTIRAGGHLAFNPFWADYYLLARDIEVVPENGRSTSTLAAIIADMEQRSQQYGLVRTELPEWVKQLAPRELRHRYLEVDGGQEVEETVTAARPPSGQLLSVLSARSVEERLAVPGLPTELVSYLSEAMDRNEDIQLTPQLLSRFDPLPHELVQPPSSPEGAGRAGLATASQGSAAGLEPGLPASAETAQAVPASDEPYPLAEAARQRSGFRLPKGDDLIWLMLGAAVIMLLLLMVTAFVLALVRTLPG
jgi:hypothetical protein